MSLQLVRLTSNSLCLKRSDEVTVSFALGSGELFEHSYILGVKDQCCVLLQKLAHMQTKNL